MEHHTNIGVQCTESFHDVNILKYEAPYQYQCALYKILSPLSVKSSTYGVINQYQCVGAFLSSLQYPQIYINIEYFISPSLLSQQHAYMDPARLVLAGLGVYILLVF